MTNKTLIVAVSEFTTLTRSKAFLLGIAMMPIIMGIALGVQKFTRNTVDTKDRPFVVIDRNGAIYGAIASAADEWNRAAVGSGTQKAPRYLPSQTTFAPDDEAARAALSDQVRKEQI